MKPQQQQKRHFDFDANATHAVKQEAWHAWQAANERFAAGLTGESGAQATRAIAQARAQLADIVGAHPEEIFWTTGGTQADAQALLSATLLSQPCHLLVSALEHRAVLAAAQKLVQNGQAQLQIAPALPSGLVDVEATLAMCDAQTTLLSVLHAHNETGALQPIAALARALAGTSTLVHTDAVQALGRVPLFFCELGVDMMSLAGHKVGAVGGVGTLVVARNSPAYPLFAGGIGPSWSPGFATWGGAAASNVCGILSFAAAAQASVATVHSAPAIQACRQQLELGLQAQIAGVQILAAQVERLPNTTLVRFFGVEAEALLMALDMAGFAVSAGAACSAGSRQASASLQAMGLDAQAAKEAVRISLTPQVGPPQIEALLQAIADAVRRARALA